LGHRTSAAAAMVSNEAPNDRADSQRPRAAGLEPISALNSCRSLAGDGFHLRGIHPSFSPSPRALRKRTAVSERMEAGEDMRGSLSRAESPVVGVGHQNISGRDSPRMKRSTLNSSRMMSGDGVRDALTMSPNSVRRMISMPPRLLKSDDESTVSTATAGDITRRVSSAASPQRSPQASSRWSLNASPRGTSPRFDFRAKKTQDTPFGCDGDPAFFIGTSHGGASPRAAEDHLWRELFHSETEERKAMRLRGSGEAIGARGRASAGIPWRQIPAFNRKGIVAETGDPHYNEHMRRSTGMAFKRRGEFSPLHAGTAMHDVLAPDNNENQPPTDGSSRKVSSREAWLEVVKQRFEAKRERQSPPLRSSRSPSGKPSEACSPHWAFRNLRKPVPTEIGAVSSTENTVRDGCPFFREDCIPESRSVALATPARRAVMEPPSTLLGGAPLPKEGNGAVIELTYAAEKVSEARRDWQHMQRKLQCEQEVSQAMAMSQSTSQQSLGQSMSAKGLPPSLVNHVRSRATVAGKTRWK